MFKSLSSAYQKELATFTWATQGVLKFEKGDFYNVFYRAWKASFTLELIQKAFTATGISLPNLTPILKKFSKGLSSDSPSPSKLTGSNWVKMESLIRQIAKEKGSEEVKVLSQTLHYLMVQNNLLHHEIRRLLDAIDLRVNKQKSYPLKLRQNKEKPHGGAVFWSPRKIREARERRAEKLQKRDQEKLQKVERRQLQEQARLYKVRIDQEKRVAREAAKEARVKERAEKEAERARQKAHRDSKKAIQQAQNGKRKASKVDSNRNKRQKRVADSVVGEGEASGAAPVPPPKVTRHGRNIILPGKYK